MTIQVKQWRSWISIHDVIFQQSNTATDIFPIIFNDVPIPTSVQFRWSSHVGNRNHQQINHQSHAELKVPCRFPWIVPKINKHACLISILSLQKHAQTPVPEVKNNALGILWSSNSRSTRWRRMVAALAALIHWCFVGSVYPGFNGISWDFTMNHKD